MYTYDSLKLAFLSLWLFGSFSTLAQNKAKVDSLQKALNTDVSAKEKVDIYNLLAKEYNRSDSAKVAQYTKQAIALAQANNYSIGMIDAWYQLGLVAMLKGHATVARQYFGQVRQTAQKTGYTKGRAQAWHGLGKLHESQGNYADALKAHHQSLAISKQLNDKPGMAGSYNGIGVAYWRLGDLSQAIVTYRKSLKIYKRLGNKRGVASSYHNIGIVYKHQGDYSQALKMYKNSLKIEEQLGDELGVAISYNSLGVICHYYQGNYPEALKMYQQAIKIYEKLGYKRGLGDSYNNIGLVYTRQEDYPQALKMHQRALQARMQLGDKRGMARSYHNIATVYEEQNNFGQARKMYEKAVTLCEQIGNKNGAAMGYFGLGALVLKQKRPDKAKQYFEQALVLHQQMGEKDLVVQVWLHLGMTYYALQQYHKALPYLNQSMQGAHKTGNPVTIRNAAEYLAKVYKATHKYQLAYENLELYKSMSDSLLNKKNIKKIAQLETQYTYGKKQDSLKLAQTAERRALTAEINTQKANQRATLIGSSLLGLLLLALGGFYYAQRRSKHKLALAHAQLLSLDQFKHQMLGMIVHDLKNPLNSIIGLSEAENGNPHLMAINRSGKRMHHLVMNILEVQKMEDQQMPLAKVVTPLGDLVKEAVVQVSFIAQEKNQTIQANALPNALLEVDSTLLVRVLVNLLTNATKYTAQNQKIWIKAETTDTHCKVLVIDTGVGIALEFVPQVFDKFAQAHSQQSGRMRATGLGLTFCKLAVEAHGGEIGVESVLGEGSTFWFCLPLATPEAEELATSQPTHLVQAEASEPTFVFTSKELAVLEPIVAHIKTCQVYQTGKIIKALEDLEPSATPALQDWQLALEDALLAYNEVRVNELLEVTALE
ncbi:tetratricopeptide repeat-containing sensor histidine kinase [uncultured Microscilla sp.]|uniref:ATP-binding protein n=1 Tax=uncultured Microscilla sp. TaxID=432653 RepID=UPI0026292002|nr:tetratricopeptide repeat-containing sensor histidine kinase [uncultured Microscilla sp.]